MNQPNSHIPVLLNEVRDALFQDISGTITLFDGTLGGGGYTQQFINFATQNKMQINQFSSDLDQSAIDRVLSYIKVPEGQNLEIRQGNFAEVIAQFENNFFDGITLDLGFSSNQLTESGRGFSYQQIEEPLDLRYNTETGKSASQKLLTLHNWQQLGKVIYEYSGEDLAMRIAKQVYAINKKTPWTVGEFVDVVISVIPITALKRKNQILSRVWQGLRIWVNNEFESLQSFLPIALQKLKLKGKLAIVSFHSLEDKIVTKYFRSRCKPTKEDDFGNKEFEFKLLNARPITPSDLEIESNPRARSAVLRIIQKL
jgi:16S rRNA (cytosine1402-N4)-methyltransferase